MKLLYNNVCLYFFSTNQRSKVKGTLEIYHAYISDSNGAIDTGENDTADSEGWELLDQPTSPSNLTPEEQPAEVIIIIFSI